MVERSDLERALQIARAHMLSEAESLEAAAGAQILVLLAIAERLDRSEMASLPATPNRPEMAVKFHER